MSYILEALKKSEAERQQGAVPDLTAAPVRVLISPEPVPRYAYLLGAAVLVGAGVLLGWWRPWQPTRPEAAVSVPVAPAELKPSAPPQARTVAAPVAPAPAPSAAAEPVPAAVMPAAPSPQTLEPAPVRAERATPTPAKTTQSAAIAPKPRPKPSTLEPKPSALATSTEPADQPTLKAAPTPRAAEPVAEGKPPARILRFSELPPAIARSIPRITVSGYALTDDPNSRIVVINEQMLSEGDQVATGLKLERIGPDGVVLNYKGYRFRPAP